MNFIGIEVSTALRRLFSALEKLSSDDMAKLADPAFEVEVKFTRRRSKESSEELLAIDLNKLVEDLSEFPSRNEASSFLSQAAPTKKILEKIARHLDIPIFKQDNADTMREKIIEATAGARLRSEAIKGGN
jgi:hypothetical protein